MQSENNLFRSSIRASEFKLVQLIGLIAALVWTGPTLAQSQTSHVHGRAELNVALAGQQVQFEFTSPAINLLGFERDPNSEAEAELFSEVSTKLLTAEWLLGDDMASCTLAESSVLAPDFEENAHQHHGHEGDADFHANFRVQYLFDCPTTPTGEIRVSAFEHFNGIETITVQWISTSQQGRVVLSTRNPVLNLQ